MKVNLQEVQELKDKLNAALLEKESVLTYSDKEAIQHVNNIEYYLLSNANYDASCEISSLSNLMGYCSKDIAMLLGASLERLHKELK